MLFRSPHTRGDVERQARAAYSVLRWIGSRDASATATTFAVWDMLAYALGRRLEGYDEIVVDNLMHEVAEDGYRMQTLIKGVVSSYPFTHRRIGRKEEL